MSNYILGLDIGSFEVKANIAKVTGKELNICGTGKSKTSGIKRGVVTNIEQASSAIKFAVNEAKKSSGVSYDTVVVSISGAYTKYTKSTGIINIPNGEIGISEIKRAMQMAEQNANIPNDSVKLHILPYDFKVDTQEHIEDPLGMSGNRLEVLAHVVTVPKTSVKNLEKSVRMAGINIDNIVLSGYASAISTLNKEEKELGVCVIDMGAATCDIAVHLGNSLVHNDVLLIGSANITNDISKALHTPLLSAENVKINYSKLRDSNCKSLDLPVLGNDLSKNKVDMEIITNIIYARIEETLMLLAKKLEDSKQLNKLGAGIVLTGGMSKLDDIRQLTTAIFENQAVRIASPKPTEGLYDKDPTNACSIGLCMYGAGYFTPYEIDSNGELRYKDEIKKINSNTEEELDKTLNDSGENSSNILLDASLNSQEKASKKPNVFAKLWNTIVKSF